jgi:enoyl-CoA hydratase/carnithine racemase
MADALLVRFEKDSDIGVIIVDNPPVNALSPGVPQGIVAALDKGNADPAVKAMVLIGAGRSFIAGADIRQFGKGPAQPAPTRRHYDVMDQSPKPVVAAIHGYALGGGLETALACHYRVAVPSAKVGLPEVLIGILPGAGGTQRLPRLIGPARAKDLVYTGRFVDAGEALRIGLVDQVVPDGDVYDAATRLAAQFRAGPAQALRAAKQAIDTGLGLDLDAGLEVERLHFSALFGTEDQKRGMRSFVENGPGRARFVGR